MHRHNPAARPVHRRPDGPGRSKIFSNSADSYLKVPASWTDGSQRHRGLRRWGARALRPAKPNRVVLTTTDCTGHHRGCTPCSTYQPIWKYDPDSTGSERASRVRYGTPAEAFRVLPHSAGRPDDLGRVLPTNQGIRLHGGGAGRHGTADMSHCQAKHERNCHEHLADHTQIKPQFRMIDGVEECRVLPTVTANRRCC